MNQRIVLSRLRVLMPLLKEASTRCETELGVLTNPKAKEEAAVGLRHALARLMDSAPRDDDNRLGELISDSLALFIELDRMWHFERPSSIRFVDEALIIKVDETFMPVIMQMADARASVFSMKLAISTDPNGELSRVILATLLPGAARNHYEYGKALLAETEACPF